MADTIIARARQFLSAPREAYRSARDDPAVTVLRYFGILLFIYAVVSTVLAAIIVSITSVITSPVPGTAAGALGAAAIIYIILVLISGTISSFVFSIWVHLWVRIFGGRNGIMQTVKVVLYGMTPLFVLGWVPAIGFIFSLWSLALDYHGIQELCGLGARRAALAIIIPVVILLIAAAVVFFWYLVPLSIHQFEQSRA